MSHHTLSVAGLRCAHCVEILERNLRRLPGVRRVEVRPADERVEVDADPRLVGPAVLAAAVRDSGLHVQGEKRSLWDLDEPAGEEPGAEEATAHSGGHEAGELDLGDLGELDFGEPGQGAE